MLQLKTFEGLDFKSSIKKKKGQTKKGSTTNTFLPTYRMTAIINTARNTTIRKKIIINQKL